MERVLLALNGQPENEIKDYKNIIETDYKMVIAADGGALFLEKLGLRPDVIIGDLDSLSDKKIKKLKSLGVKIIKYPVEKNETDGELALEYCAGKKFKDVTIVGALGGRQDQQLANIFLLEYAYKNGIIATIKEPGFEMGLVDKEKHFFGLKGSSLSLIPLDKIVEGVTISGCKYNLNDEKLYRYKTRGISNLIIKEKASVFLDHGLLLYIIE